MKRLTRNARVKLSFYWRRPPEMELSLEVTFRHSQKGLGWEMGEPNFVGMTPPGLRFSLNRRLPCRLAYPRSVEVVPAVGGCMQKFCQDIYNDMYSEFPMLKEGFEAPLTVEMELTPAKTSGEPPVTRKWQFDRRIYSTVKVLE